MKPALELVTTGAELLNGGVVNRHAQWLGYELSRIGWSLARDTTVPDDVGAIREAVGAAMSRADVVIVTGGLGPTSDDVTRDVAADWFGTRVVMDEPSRQTILKSYRDRNKPLNATVERHALVVEGARVLTNHHGLAAGQHLEKNARHLFLLPGPPREFQGMVRDHILPWLDGLHIAPPLRRRVLQTIGLGESDIAAMLERDGYGDLSVETAYCAQPARVSIRINEQPGHSGDFDRALAMLRAALGPAIYAEADETIEASLARLLKQKGRTLAVAESCTGGMVGQRLTAVAGSSAFMRGGVIAYHNDIKSGVLGVRREDLDRYGAVSEAVACAMAEGVRELCEADIGIAITGIAGPDGGTPDKPVGLVYISVADAVGCLAQELRLGGERETIREASATMALNLARLRLVG